MKKYFLVFLGIITCTVFSCSTQKNTSTTRTYHNITAKYNVYFNGKESYDLALKKIETDYKESYSSLIPIFQYSSDEAVKLVKSDMDKTLTKMGKTITVHSITAKPKLKGDLTPKDKEFMKKNEYCRWVDDAYLLIGKADFYHREYNKSLNSFRRIVNLYKTEDTRFDAQLWIAKVYIEQKKYKDAYNYLIELENDKRHPKKLDQELTLTFADYYIRIEDYPNAIDRIKSGIKLTKNKKQKARFYYILAQLELKQGNNTDATKYLTKVTKLADNYDLVFSAKILQATAFSAGQNSNEIKKDLKKMLKDEKNDEYKDQIYYALAIIEQKEKNEPQAIEYFKLSTKSSVSNNNQKAISFLALADIHFNKKLFFQAGQYYDSTMQYLDKNFGQYDFVSKRAENTGFLVQHLSEVQKQDSLQRIAKMQPEDRLRYIDDIIQKIIQEEERLKNDNNNNFDPNDFSNNPNNLNQDGGKWYMYNPVLVSRGQNDFKKKWGNRKLEDDWRRKNKTFVDDNEDNKVGVDSNRITDNKKREFYLQDLPLTDSALNVSNELIAASLFAAAEVYFHKLNDINASISTYEELLIRFQNFDLKLETYYRLYNQYKAISDNNKTEYYRQLIILNYPDSKYAKLLLDPNYLNNVLNTETQAYILFDKSLSAYNKGEYNQALNFCNEGILYYPESQAIPNFIFIKAKSYGSLGYRDSLTFYLNTIVKKFPKTDLANLSTEILALVQSGKYDYDIYKRNQIEEHLYIIIVLKKYNTTELKFKIKQKAEEFSNEKNFEIKNQDFDNKYSLITISTFLNEPEAEMFYKTIYKSDIFNNIKEEYYNFFISKTNFDLLMKNKTIETYDFYFKKTFSNIQ